MTQICRGCGKAKTTDSDVLCLDCWSEKNRKKRPQRITIDIKKAFGVENITAKLTYERKKYITHPEEIKLLTTAPCKWRFVDIETGEVYWWNTRRKRFSKDYAAEVIR